MRVLPICPTSSAQKRETLTSLSLTRSISSAQRRETLTSLSLTRSISSVRRREISINSILDFSHVFKPALKPGHFALTENYDDAERVIRSELAGMRTFSRSLF